MQIDSVRREYRRIPLAPSNYISQPEDEDGNPIPIPVITPVESIKKKSKKTKETKMLKFIDYPISYYDIIEWVK